MIPVITRYKNYIKNNPKITASTILFSGITMLVFNYFIQFMIQTRMGVEIPDPVLALFNPIDLSIPIAFFFYGAQVLCFADIWKSPHHIVLGIQSYTLMIIVRMVMMGLLPLDPPGDNIVLYDPVMVWMNGSANIPTKDLFFSGHTSTTFLTFLIAKTPKIRNILLYTTFIVGIMMVLQKTHYSIDVMAAPFFAYGSYRMIHNLITPREDK